MHIDIYIYAMKFEHLIYGTFLAVLFCQVSFEFDNVSAWNSSAPFLHSSSVGSKLANIFAKSYLENYAQISKKSSIFAPISQNF